MTELTYVLLGCIGLYTLVNFTRSETERNPWVGGYSILTAYICWLVLGSGYAVLMLLVGTGLLVGLSLLPRLRRPIFERWSIALTPVALLVTILLGALFRVSLPLTSFSPDALPGLATAMIGGFLAAEILELRLSALPLVQLRERRGQLLFSVLYTWLAILLAPTVFSSGAGLLLVVMTVLTGHILFLQEAQQTRYSLNRRTREITLLRDLSQSMPGDLDGLLFHIYQLVTQLIDVSIFYIALYDEERQTLEFRLVMLDGQQREWATRKLGSDSATERVLQVRKPLRLNQRQEIPELQDYLSEPTAVDFLGVPLLVSDQVVGVMAVADTGSDTLRASDVNILQTVANQIGLAVRNATLYARQTELVDKLSRINNSVHQVLFSRNQVSALKSACQTAAFIGDSSKVAIFLRENDHLALQTTAGLTEAHRAWLQAHPPELRDKVCVIANMQDQAQDKRREESAAGKFQAVVELPLRSDREPQGMLAIYYDEPRYFRQREFDLLETLANQITAMLENVRLFTVMERHATEMSQLVQLSRISTSSLNLTEVLHDIAEMLQQMAAVNRVTIYLLEPEAQRARLMASVNSIDHSVHSESDYLPMFPELSDLSPFSSTHVFQHNDANISSAMSQQMTDHAEHTVAVIPLVLENLVLGAVLLGNHETRYFEKHEWQFIEMATNQITGQINNIKLHEKILRDLNRRLAQIEVIEDVAQQVSSSLNFNTVIQHVLAAAMNATDADLVSLGLVTETSQFWVMERRIHDNEPVYRFLTQNKESGLLGQVLRQGETVIIADHREVDFYVSDYPDQYHSSMGVPLSKADTVVGVLNVESTRTNAFHSEHASFLSRLAGHAVMSIENARFLEERQREIEMLQSLRELAVWLISADDTRSVGHEILETAVQLLEGQNAALYQYEQENNQLRTLVKLWFSETRSVNAEETLPYRVAQEAAQSGEVVMITDVTRHHAFSAVSYFNYRSVLAIPLQHARQVHYVILITFEEMRRLMERDLNTIDLLAGQAVGHLENARLHERIRAGRDQMRAILNSTQDGMILLDRKGNLIETNPAAHRLLGFNLEEHIGQSFPKLVAKQDENGVEVGYTSAAIDGLMRTLQSQAEQETHHDIRRVNEGQVIYIEEIGLPVLNAEQEIIGRLLVLRDVTKARLLDEQREDLADMVVHDLRGPLGSIRNAVDLAQATIGEPENKLENEMLLSSSSDNVSRLIVLVETLLDIARMQSPDMALDLEPVALPELVETAHIALATSIQKAAIRYTVAIPSDLPRVNVDRDKIVRVLINLLDNAVRYTPSSGEIMVKACVSEEDRQWIIVYIEDSGPGIPLERRDDIFDRFRRIPGQKPQRGHKGHGLGLNFTRQAIEKHGGTIKIVDHCDLPGACFKFTLPVYHSPSS